MPARDREQQRKVGQDDSKGKALLAKGREMVAGGVDQLKSRRRKPSAKG